MRTHLSSPRPQALLAWSFVTIGTLLNAHAGGEPAEDFVKRLRAANYYDTAIAYLDRLDEFPGVDFEYLKARELERSQTFIDAAFASRSTTDRDEYFQKAEDSLKKFLAEGDSPRQSEARLQLGKIQMIRAAQLMIGEPDDQKRALARESYEGAAATFEQIVESLRAKLKEMRGAKIDAQSNPEEAARRDQYKGEFLEAMMNSGEALIYAAKTYPDPGKQAKAQLEKALVSFTDLSEKYSDYVQGAIALLRRGQIQEMLGQPAPALESYMRMLDTVDAPQLREAKFGATSGMVRLSMSQSPPAYDEAITRGEQMLKTARPDERRLPGFAELQVDLAKAFLAKSKDEANLKGPERKKAESEGRQLLVAASKVAGDHLETATKLLSDLGIDKLADEKQLPTAEPPKDFEDALEKSLQIYRASEALIASIDAEQDPGQKESLQDQLEETQSIGIQILRQGLTMISVKSDANLVNQARQILTLFLYREGRYREASVVGMFLAKNAPSSETGLNGGVISLNALQMLLRDDDDNEFLVSTISSFGDYLSKTWPDDPQAANAKEIRVKLALKGERWDEARELILEMDSGPAQASLRRLLGQYLWADAIGKLQAGENDAATNLMQQARDDLKAGLDDVAEGLADERVMSAGLTLAKIHLRLDESTEAEAALSNSKYGPLTLISKLGNSDDSFASDLYGTELQVVVQLMTSDGANLDNLLKRAGGTMDNLRDSVKGEDASKKLEGIYLRLARSIREQLDTAAPAKKAKLIKAFRVFLEQVAGTTQDNATLLWIGQTLMQLGESTMNPGETKAIGNAAELMTAALSTFEKISGEEKSSPSVIFQMGRAQRLLGQYSASINSFEGLLKTMPTMIDAQIEAATAYEQWAATLPPKFAPKSYAKALNGAKPDAKGNNVIWGWGKISKQTMGNEKFRDTFFDARYHLALCRFLWGKALKNNDIIKKSSGDITMVAALYPDLGGNEQRAKFDALLKQIQQASGEPAKGLDAQKKN
ncbi:hypothetical protein Pla22_01030 [Rubripirellula amarantea]|uniref:Tetratricopeptide repeat protein n=1 Tax=Rubripirellula amarantea TaxID=2527999 RepID=A0A5C5WQP8_9BACT|nr:hypothetical protein [Rubripirellula amarantea]TWT52479.1 hypothetical protein Pla22_01030 [Rubripirellula amarantea]